DRGAGAPEHGDVRARLRDVRTVLAPRGCWLWPGGRAREGRQGWRRRIRRPQAPDGRDAEAPRPLEHQRQGIAPGGFQMGDIRNFALWVSIVLLLLALFTLFHNPSSRPTTARISYWQLRNEVDQGRVRDVLIRGQEITGTYTDGRVFSSYAPYDRDPTLMQRLTSKGVTVSAAPVTDSVPWFVSLLV